MNLLLINTLLRLPKNICRPATKVTINGSVDWDKCIFCQDNKDGALQWPFGTKRSGIDPLTTYEKTASAIQEFDKIRSLPMPLNMAFFDEGKGIASTLVDNQTKFYKNCRKLDR